jgi:hypothetical protein
MAYFMEDLIGGGGMAPASSRPSRLLRVPRGEGPSSSSLKATLLRVPLRDGGRDDFRFKDSVVV